MKNEFQPLLNFWFADTVEQPDTIPGRMGFWFASNPDQDKKLEQRFGALTSQAVAGELLHWLTDPRGRLAHILVLDQWPRCLYRGKPAAFEQDNWAAALCLAGVRQKIDAQLSATERAFFYMPLQHAEDLAAQQAGVDLYQQLENEQQDLQEIFTNFRQYAELHWEIVHRFGRFPHRNKILGRTNTREEQEYLDQGASSFGQ